MPRRTRACERFFDLSREVVCMIECRFVQRHLGSMVFPRVVLPKRLGHVVIPCF